MRLKSITYGTYPAGRSRLYVPLNLPPLNATKRGLCIAAGNKTGNLCTFLRHPALSNLSYLTTSVFAYCVRWFVVQRNPVPSVLYIACGFSENPKSSIFLTF